MQTYLEFVELIGVVVFAIAGSLVASRKELDIFGFCLVACVTGVGGGTLRDLLLGRTVFWVADATSVYLCIGTAIVTYFTAHIFARRYPVILWADGIGICIYGVLGAHIAAQSGAGLIVAVTMGMMTATFGGLIRDVICKETPLLLTQEVYALCPSVAAAVFLLAMQFGLPVNVAGVLGFAVGFGLRASVLIWGLVLPKYKSRPGNKY